MEKNLKVYMYITESLCYTPETNTLWISYNSIKKAHTMPFNLICKPSHTQAPVPL